MAGESNVTDAQIQDAFQGTSYGGRDHRKLVEQGLLKRNAGYYCGHVLTTIMVQLGLLTEKGRVTKKGHRFLYAAFRDDFNAG